MQLAAKIISLISALLFAIPTLHAGIYMLRARAFAPSRETGAGLNVLLEAVWSDIVDEPLKRRPRFYFSCILAGVLLLVVGFALDLVASL